MMSIQLCEYAQQDESSYKYLLKETSKWGNLAYEPSQYLTDKIIISAVIIPVKIDLDYKIHCAKLKLHPEQQAKQ